MPRWEVTDVDRELHPIQVLSYFFGFSVFGFSIFLLINRPDFSSTVLFIIGLSYVIYLVGRLYGLIMVNKDFVEITKDSVTYRSTPPFGGGWLPQTRTYPFDQIQRADIVQIAPFYDPKNTVMAIKLSIKNERDVIIGNHLTQEQIVRVGLALQGTVTFSNALKRFLNNTEDMGEQIKDLIKKGKSYLEKFTSTKSNKGDSNNG